MHTASTFCQRLYQSLGTGAHLLHNIPQNLFPVLAFKVPEIN